MNKVKQNSKPNIISVQVLEKAYEFRGLATEKEREIEDEIFPVTGSHTREEIDNLITKYKKAKMERSIASLYAAELFMLATPEVRKSANWRKFTPGHENDEGRGAKSSPDVREGANNQSAIFVYGAPTCGKTFTHQTYQYQQRKPNE